MLLGARSETRTRKGLLPGDFKSPVYTKFHHPGINNIGGPKQI